MNKPAKFGKSAKLVAVGNSTGLILPKEVMAKLRVRVGDMLTIVETSDGIELRVYDPDFDQQMEVAREVMARRRAALRELAK